MTRKESIDKAFETFEETLSNAKNRKREDEDQDFNHYILLRKASVFDQPSCITSRTL
jgi:hypothetical protein